MDSNHWAEERLDQYLSLSQLEPSLKNMLRNQAETISSRAGLVIT